MLATSSSGSYMHIVYVSSLTSTLRTVVPRLKRPQIIQMILVARRLACFFVLLTTTGSTRFTIALPIEPALHHGYRSNRRDAASGRSPSPPEQTCRLGPSTWTPKSLDFSLASWMDIRVISSDSSSRIFPAPSTEMIYLHCM